MDPHQIDEKYGNRDIIRSESNERVKNNAVRHTYRELNDNEKTDMVVIKDAGAEMLHVLDVVESHYPHDRKKSRELELARVKIEEAVMWAVKHVTA